jgi:hypothetical protein
MPPEEPSKKSSLGKLFEPVPDDNNPSLDSTEGLTAVSSYDDIPDEVSVGSSPSTDSDSRSSSSGASQKEHEETKFAQCMTVLKTVNDFILDKLEVDEEDKSEARKNDEANLRIASSKIAQLQNKHNDKTSRYGSDLEAYRDFVQNIDPKSQDLQITSEKINQLRANLKETKEIDYITRKAFQARRALIGGMAGFFINTEDIEKYDKLSKTEKQKIKLTRELIDIEANPASVDKEAKYAEINNAFRELDKKDKQREKRDSMRIIARQSHRGKLFTTETGRLFQDKTMHPYNKIIDNEELSAAAKTLRVGAKFVEKTAQGTAFVAKAAGQKALESVQSMVRHSVKQPLATVYRGSMATLNAVEYLTLEAQILNETDETVKAALREKAEIKFKNMGYDGEQFLRAAVATAGIALLDTATIASFGTGVAASALIGMTASEKFLHGVLFTAQVADHIQTAADGVELINQKAEYYHKKKESLSLEEKRVIPRRNAVIEPKEVISIRASLERRQSSTTTVTRSSILKIFSSSQER